MSYMEDQSETALLFRIEGLVASGTRSLDFHEVAGTLCIPEDTARRYLAKLRDLQRLSAHVEAGKVMYAVGDRCQAARRINEKPSRPPDSSIPKGVVTAEKKRITVELEPADPPPLVREEPPKLDPRTPGRARTKDGTTKRVVDLFETTDRPLLASEVSALAEVTPEKTERTLRYLRAVRGLVRIEVLPGGENLYFRTSRPYPADRVGAHDAKTAELEQQPVEPPSPRTEAIERIAEHAAAAPAPDPEVEPAIAEVFVDTPPAERDFLKSIPRFSKRSLLPLLDKPLVEASINADGEILIIDGGEIVVIPQHQSRAVARLIRRLDQAGLLDG